MYYGRLGPGMDAPCRWGYSKKNLEQSTFLGLKKI
jgi:hypothetical protein